MEGGTRKCGHLKKKIMEKPRDSHRGWNNKQGALSGHLDYTKWDSGKDFKASLWLFLKVGLL